MKHLIAHIAVLLSLLVVAPIIAPRCVLATDGVVQSIKAPSSSQVVVARPPELKGLDRWLEPAEEFAKSILDFQLYQIEGQPLTIGTAITAIFLFALGMFLSRRITGLVSKKVLNHFDIHEGALAAIESISFYVLVLFFALFSLKMAHVPLTIFTFLGGAVAIGVGFGSQNLMNNFISGLILLIEQPIRVGDLIEIGGLNGRILRIGLRSTLMRNSSNIDMIIPNSSLLESNVINWTLGDPTARLHVRVGVAYGSPTELVIEKLLEAANAHEKVLRNPEPLVWFVDFGDNSLNFELHFWAVVRAMKNKRTIESEIRLTIDRLFRESGLVIAFPQRDIHIDSTAPVAVRVVNS